MRLGMSVIDTAFEKLDIDEANSDSEDEGETPYKTDPILEPKVTDKTNFTVVYDWCHLWLIHTTRDRDRDWESTIENNGSLYLSLSLCSVYSI